MTFLLLTHGLLWRRRPPPRVRIILDCPGVELTQ